MDFGKYDFLEIYSNVYEKEKMDFRTFAILVSNGIEMEFRYKGENYFVVNGPSALGKTDAYWFFGNGENRKNKYCCMICPFEEKERLVEFLENFEIDGLSLKQIFDEKIYISEEQDKDNCMTWIA